MIRLRVLGLLGLLVTGCAPGNLTAAPACRDATAASCPINMLEAGAAGNGEADDSDALQAAFDEARRSGRPVWLPEGKYRYSRQLRMDGITVYGSGPGTQLLAAVPTEQRILMTGDGPELACMRILYHDLQRSGKEHGRKGIMIDRARDFAVRNVIFDGRAFTREPKYGGGAVFVRRSSGGRILNNHIIFSTADSVHITGEAHDILVQGNRIEHSGDDGIAVVNYGKAFRNDVVIRDNVVLNNRWGRNITSVGGHNVQMLNNFISGNATNGAGIYVASESAYKTAGPANILIRDNTIRETGGPGKGHGQIMLWNGNDQPVRDVRIVNNTVQASRRADLAIVVSNAVERVVLDGNTADAKTSLRGVASVAESGTKLERVDRRVSPPLPPAPDIAGACSRGPKGSRN
jgi:hypothetical protein